MAAPSCIPVGSRVIQAVGSHISLATRGQQNYSTLHQGSMPLGQHQLPIQPIIQNGKHALPTTSISPNTYGRSFLMNVLLMLLQ